MSVISVSQMVQQKSVPLAKKAAHQPSLSEVALMFKQASSIDHFHQLVNAASQAPSRPQTGGPHPKAVNKLQGAVQRHVQAGRHLQRQHPSLTQVSAGQTVYQTNVAKNGNGGKPIHQVNTARSTDGIPILQRNVSKPENSTQGKGTSVNQTNSAVQTGNHSQSVVGKVGSEPNNGNNADVQGYSIRGNDVTGPGFSTQGNRITVNGTTFSGPEIDVDKL